MHQGYLVLAVTNENTHNTKNLVYPWDSAENQSFTHKKFCVNFDAIEHFILLFPGCVYLSDIRIPVCPHMRQC